MPPLSAGLPARGSVASVLTLLRPGQNDWPVIVIELVGEEERAGKAVILRTVVSVVLVGGDGVASETIVLRSRQQEAGCDGGK